MSKGQFLVIAAMLALNSITSVALHSLPKKTTVTLSNLMANTVDEEGKPISLPVGPENVSASFTVETK